MLGLRACSVRAIDRLGWPTGCPDGCAVAGVGQVRSWLVLTVVIRAELPPPAPAGTRCSGPRSVEACPGICRALWCRALWCCASGECARRCGAACRIAVRWALWCRVLWCCVSHCCALDECVVRRGDARGQPHHPPLGGGPAVHCGANLEGRAEGLWTTAHCGKPVGGVGDHGTSTDQGIGDGE